MREEKSCLAEAEEAEHETDVFIDRVLAPEKRDDRGSPGDEPLELIDYIRMHLMPEALSEDGDGLFLFPGMQIDAPEIEVMRGVRGLLGYGVFAQADGLSHLTPLFGDAVGEIGAAERAAGKLFQPFEKGESRKGAPFCQGAEPLAEEPLGLIPRRCRLVAQCGMGVRNNRRSPGE